MHQHTATVEWARQGERFVDRRYSRAHLIRFDGGAVVPGSSSPLVVRAPMSDPSAVDPEEAFVASLSSCHMLWFLHLACDAGFVVDSYVDHAVGTMLPREDGREWVARVDLHPVVRFVGDGLDAAALAALHHHAHEVCFIANSVKTEIRVVPRAA